MEKLPDVKITELVETWDLYVMSSCFLSPFWNSGYLTIFNPAIEVVTFRLHGWCMLGVFLLPALARLGHEMMNTTL